MAELSHPNISRIYDIEEVGSQRFLVLEYLEGETLSQRSSRSPLSIEETVRIGKALDAEFIYNTDDIGGGGGGLPIIFLEPNGDGGAER